MLKVSVSNIAWDPSFDKEMADFFRNNNINAIDIAPSKYFSSNMNPSDSDVLKVRTFWEKQGIELIGMQSLLFGTIGFNVFSNKLIQQNMLDHLTKVAKIAQALGIKNLVFGSPKNRDASVVSKDLVGQIAHSFFNKLGEIGLKNNVIFCIEPNPPSYGCNFITNSLSAYEMVKAINHPSIKMQLDTGTIATNNEDFKVEVPIYVQEVGHIHLSTTDLKPIFTDKKRLTPIVNTIKKNFDNNFVTIEMLAQNSSEVFNSILFAQEILS
jgi:D-psicose/D-tagatose/L-ribulose 3-epimerase